MFYQNSYVHGVDDKGRVQIPSKWDPEPGTELRLILSLDDALEPTCLLVLTPPLWKIMADKLQALPFLDEQATALRRHVGENSDVVTIDDKGRIKLPENLAEQAGITKEVMLIGLVDRFEIWNPAKRKASRKKDLPLTVKAMRSMI